ncbi:MAG TPA: hypothetical protein VFY68_15415 [Nitrososphaeraceae archaeon]|nr:hypothetical protein [Nitrososphaeraceae archaeon]
MKYETQYKQAKGSKIVTIVKMRKVTHYLSSTSKGAIRQAPSIYRDDRPPVLAATVSLMNILSIASLLRATEISTL